MIKGKLAEITILTGLCVAFMSQLAFLVWLAGLSTPDATTTVSGFAHSLLFELLDLEGFRKVKESCWNNQGKEKISARKNRKNR